MKKILTLTFLSVLALSFLPQKSAAQITAFVQHSLTDSFDTYCSFPSYRMISAHTVATGTIIPGDSIVVEFNFGDASTFTYSIPANTSNSAYANHAYTFPGTFTTRVIFTATSGVADTLYTAPVTINDTCANLSGRLYADNNNDCTYNSGDLPFAHELAKIKNISTSAVYYAITDSNGIYNIDVPGGFTYDITKAALWGYTPICPLSGIQTVSVTTGSYVEDLAYQCSPTNDIDLSVTGSAWTFRPGFNRAMYIYAGSDNACIGANTTVTLTLDPRLTYTSTLYGTPPTTVSGQVLTWNVVGMDQMHPLISDIYVFCDSAAVQGDTICNLVTVDTPALYNDPDTTNNMYNICGVVTNAVDPNEKEVMPKGAGTPGYIANSTMLSYVVNFQNTGTAAAINVTVKDTLDNNVDINTLHFISSSHPVTISTLPGNILVFRFDNINLPDSGADMAGSHGFVMYSVRPKNPLSPLSTIHNKASIYFDFNSAVITNTTLNTISPVSVQRITKGNMEASVYPNPANNKLMVDMKGSFTLTLYDVLGRPVTTQNGDNKAEINTTAIPQGVYMLKISNATNEMTTRIDILH